MVLQKMVPSRSHTGSSPQTARFDGFGSKGSTSASRMKVPPILEGLITDITESKEREEELQRSDTILTTIEDVVFVVDDEWQLEYVNSTAESYFEDYQDLLDRPVLDLANQMMDKSDVERFRRALQAVLENDEKITLEFEVSLPVGKTIGEFKFARFVVDGASKAAVISRDITEKKLRTQQIRILDRTLRHTIRNDMNVIRGYAETIESESSGEVAEYAQHIIEFSDSMLAMTERERNITELLSKNSVPRSTDIGLLVANLLNRASSEYPSIEFKENIEPDSFARATDEIGVAIDELIANAIRYAKDSNPIVDVHVTQSEEAIEVRVSDNGPEIPVIDRAILDGEEDIDQLSHGSGLCFWLVYLAVRESNGEVEYRRRDEGGNELIIDLPRVSGGRQQIA